jgi:hypothetical protein
VTDAGTSAFVPSRSSNDDASTEPASSGSSAVARTVAFNATPVAFAAGTRVVIVGGVVSGPVSNTTSTQ